MKKFCDGHVDCPDGSDEIETGYYDSKTRNSKRRDLDIIIDLRFVFY